LPKNPQFYSSRTYLSLGLYHELETALDDIFEKPTIVTATTTLGHLATLPVIPGENDAVILDLQVHSSIQMATQLLKARKVPVYVIRHNCMESLEKKIQHLNNKHDKIWYFSEGVYSMYGDF
jgi:7-keto-8-aminopelargonate synthetase-like enzyme